MFPSGAFGDSLMARLTTGVTVYDEGVLIATVPSLNFVGTGIQATYDSANNRVDVTVVGAPVAAGWTDDGTVVRLTTSTDQVSIGSDLPTGSEKLHVAGQLAIDTSTVPFTIVQSAAGGGSGITIETLVGGAHTALQASVEEPDILWSLARTVQFATGALAAQRAVKIMAPTYAFVGASTISDAATFYVNAAPTAGTNATITRPFSAWFDAGNVRVDDAVLIGATALAASEKLRVTGQVRIDGATDPFVVTQLIATTGSPHIESLTGAAHTTLSASTEAQDVLWSLARTVQFATGALTTQRAVQITAPTYGFVGASTITDAVTFEVSAAPSCGTNATFTNTTGIRVASSGASITSATAATYAPIRIPAHTLTVTGTTAMTSAQGVAGINIGVITITDASAVTISNASALYIAGPPVAAGSVTLTTPLSLFVDDGSSRFDGAITNNLTTASSQQFKIIASGAVPTAYVLSTVQGGTVAADATSVLFQLATTTAGGDIRMSFGDLTSGNVAASIVAVRSGANSGYIAFTTLGAGAANPERARINQNGALLINATAQGASELLQVNGSAAITGAVNIVNSTAQFFSGISVFEVYRSAGGDGHNIACTANPTTGEADLGLVSFRGTRGSPTPMLSGDSLGIVSCRAQVANGASSANSGYGGYMKYSATENWSSTAKGTQWDLFLCAITTTTISSCLTVTTASVALPISTSFLDLSAISAGRTVIKFTKTTDTPATVWTAGVPSNNPDGYLEVTASSATRYIPFWT